MSKIVVLNLTCGENIGPPTVIPEQVRADTVVAVLSSAAISPAGFKLDSAFNVGDAVECYSIDQQYSIFDQDNLLIVFVRPNADGGVLLRKFSSSNPSSTVSCWGIVGGH